MALFINGRAPKAIRVGDTPITRVMLGEHLVFDGTVPAVVVLPRATATAAANAPAIAGGASVAMPVAAAVSEALVPSVTAGARVAAAPAEAAAAALVPSISAGVSISLPTATAVAAAAVPDFQVVASGEVLLPRAEAIATALVPSISVVAVVAPPTATAVAEALVPTVTAGGSVSLPTAVATASALAPSIAAGASVTLPRAQATAAALVPTVSVPGAITLPTATATATALVPTTTARTFPQRVATNGTMFNTSGNNPTNGQYTATYPTGSSAGDLLIMQVNFSRSDATLVSYTANAGTFTGGGAWNLIMARDGSAADGCWAGYYYCIRGSETSVTVKASVTGTWRPTGVSMVAYQAGTFDPIMPVEIPASNYTYLLSGSSAVTTPSIITASGCSEVLCMSTCSINSNATTLGTTWSAPATEILDSRLYTSAATWMVSHSAAYHQQSAAGSSQTYSATSSASTFQRVTAAIVVNSVGRTTLEASDNFNRASLGSNWVNKGGGTLFINAQQYISGVGTPSTPMSYAFWGVPVSSDNQIVEATLRWNGNDPAHSAVAVVCRANPANMPTDGASGVQFWNVNDLMGILYETSSGGFVAATGTADYISTTKFPEGARLRIVASGSTYSAYVNGKLVAQGTVSTSTVPTTAHYVGVMIQDDSAVSGGGQPPACLDDFAAYTY
ncbi:hypothetical protein [Nocardia spumae]|uniref:hypothetical protein n=1 Tax=Nocardia spumae TaxID=2887190 RepID=UPI001D132DDF|nr:hypothetical protein [Nocardia spumae]